MKLPVYFQWSVSALFGWGIYGLNLLRYWQGISGTPAYSLTKIDLESLRGSDALTLRQIAQPLVDSDHMRIRFEAEGDRMSPLDGVVLHSLGNHFNGSKWPGEAPGGVAGQRTGGVIFFEDTHLGNAQEICGRYDLIVTGSTWCEEVLRARGVDNVATVIQGVDTSLFHVAPRSGSLEGRFAVFSGGKLEIRKGQDLVLLAFRRFAARHPEAILVTAWHSPWAMPALTLNSNPGIAPIALDAGGRIDIAGWVAANGIDERQFIDLGPVPNHQMARMLREMDVALFPNRCEGGTNLVAMECMACGVPTILANNTGHKDLVATGGSFPLDRQGPVSLAEYGTEGWGESDVEEIVEALEAAWANREAARLRGLAGAEALAKLSWRNQIAQLHDNLAPLCE